MGTPVSVSSGGIGAASSCVIALRISRISDSSSGRLVDSSVGESPQCWFVIGAARWRGRSLTVVSSAEAAARAARKRAWMSSLALVSRVNLMCTPRQAKRLSSVANAASTMPRPRSIGCPSTRSSENAHSEPAGNILCVGANTEVSSQ